MLETHPSTVGTRASGRQAELGMEPRFTEELRGKLVLGRGDDDGLWLTVALWQEFSHQRLVAIQNEANRQIQELLIPFMKVSVRSLARCRRCCS